MSKRTLRNLIVALVIFLVVGGSVAFAFVHVLRSSQTLEQQIATVAAQNQQEAALIRLQKLAQNSEAERTELSSYFLLRESDSIAFLSQIESLAPSLGVSLQTEALQQINQDDKDWIQTTFSVTGSRGEVERFITVLEEIPYVSRISSVDMKGNRTGQWQANIIIQVQLLNYVQ